MVSLERPRDRAVLGHWHLKDAALRVSVLRITEKDSERSPDSAPPLLIAISRSETLHSHTEETDAR